MPTTIPTPLTEEFLSELLLPAANPDTARMARGEPGLPTSFLWRNCEVRVALVLKSWKESGPCTHGSGELYLRKHWYQLRMHDGSLWTIYFERKPRSARDRTHRWWLYTRTTHPPGPTPAA